MGVSLERVQFKFASIIGELCSEPRVLSQFAVWLDLRLAEYKLKGSISLECSNDKPDPTWLNGIKEEDEPYIVSVNKVRRLSHIDSSPNSRLHGHQTTLSEDGNKSHQFEENLAVDIGNRLSPNVPLKEEVNDCPRILPVNLSQYDNQQTSVNRRKRQSSTIIRNSSNLSSSRSDFRSPYASEDDSFYSSSQSQPIFLNPTSGGLFETPSDSITIQDKVIKEEINVDQIMTASRSQAELVLPVGSDSQYSCSKGENSEISPGEGWLEVLEERGQTTVSSFIQMKGDDEQSHIYTDDLGSHVRCSSCHILFVPFKGQRLLSSDGSAHCKECRSGIRMKSFCCSVCGKEFSKLRYLREHMNKHSNALARKCHGCGKQFTWRSGFNTHLKKCPALLGTPLLI